MNTKNDVEVVINGKQYTLCGYESSEYLQHIATHINDKFAEFKKQEGYTRLDVDMKNILLAINLSDDFFKAQKQADELRTQKEELEKEIFDMKHELLIRQEEIKDLEQELKTEKEAGQEAERKIIRLETELEQSKPGDGKSEEKKPEQTAEKEATASQNNHSGNTNYKSGNRRTKR